MLFAGSYYARLKKVPRMFIHELPSRRVDRDCHCATCGTEVREHLFFCPVCEKYYCFSCGVHTIAGVSCPECRELTFLRRVRIVS